MIHSDIVDTLEMLGNAINCQLSEVNQPGMISGKGMAVEY